MNPQVKTAIMPLFIGLALATPPAARAAPPVCELQSLSVEQFQPPNGPGGRANTIAVHPTDNNFILVASESGGLFRSENGGKRWTHVDSLPVFYTNAVAFAKDPKFVIVTASEDFSVSNHGGIWRSEDSGKTWTQVASPSAPPGVTDRFSAFEISIAPDTGNIYVATVFGVSIGDPEGKIGSWKHVDPFGAGNRRVVSVIALPKTEQGEDLVLAGGPAGVRRSLDSGTTWDPTNFADVIWDVHAFGRSPLVKDQAYAVADSKKLYFTSDGGNTWNAILTTNLSGFTTCGGISFVRAKPGPSGSIDLYYGDRCFTYKLNAVPTGSNSFNYSGTWKTLIKFPDTSEAGDTRDIAFDSKNAPILAATDGGVIKPPGRSILLPKWRFAGDKGLGNGPNGYNALQAYEVKGQWIGNSRHNLYFGTQDNSLWSSGDSGTTWTRCCNEGGYFEGEYRVAVSGDSQITLFAFGNGAQKLQGMLFTCPPIPPPNCDAGVDPWQLPKLQKSGIPKIIKKNFHVQGVNSVVDPERISPVVWSKGLGFTTDLGQTWQQYAKFNDDRRDLPKFSAPPKAKIGPVLYQAIRVGKDPQKGEITQLARIAKKKGQLNTLAAVTVPTDTNNYMKNFGGIGTGPTMNTDYRVFDVDSGDVNHVIAADVNKEQMMETVNGGYDWTEMPQLTPLVTDGGKLNFSGRIFWSPFSSAEAPVSQASAISFCPNDPSKVAVGTVQNGILISSDRGKTWKKVPESERVTLISSFHWRKADDLVVSTYGRGLWRVRFNCVTRTDNVPCRSPDCFHVYYERPPGQRPSPYDQAVLAFGGRIEGARVTHGTLEELFVQPSTTIAFAVDSREVPDIKVTETTRPVGFQGIRRVPRPPEGARMITGLTLKKRGERSELVGFLFSPRPRSMYIPEEMGEAEERPVGQEETPTERKPYLEVLSGAVVPGGTIQLAGRGLPAGSNVEIAIDGHIVERVTADREGKFSSAVQAPREFGVHSLTLIDSASRKVLDGAMVSVRPEDAPRSR
jgi:photosystem II stability/assembly factor-like uncharacterized protein